MDFVDHIPGTHTTCCHPNDPLPYCYVDDVFRKTMTPNNHRTLGIIIK